MSTAARHLLLNVNGCRWTGMRPRSGPRSDDESVRVEMRLSRRAWWLHLVVMLPIAVLYLVGPLKTGPVFNILGFSAVIAIIAGVHMHKPGARLAWYLIAAGQA